MELTPKSEQVLLDYARDAENWNGEPLVGANVRCGTIKQDKAALEDLRDKGLIILRIEEGSTFIKYTLEGKKYAARKGIVVKDDQGGPQEADIRKDDFEKDDGPETGTTGKEAEVKKVTKPAKAPKAEKPEKPIKAVAPVKMLEGVAAEDAVKAAMRSSAKRKAYDTGLDAYSLDAKEEKMIAGVTFPIILNEREVIYKPKDHVLEFTAEARKTKGKGKAEAKAGAMSTTGTAGQKTKPVKPEASEEQPPAEILPDGDPLEVTYLEEGKDYLAWIGYYGYPTIASFVKEAEEKGLLRKIKSVPKGFVPGESRMFMAHDEGVIGKGVIFGYAVLGKVEQICIGGAKVEDAKTTKAVDLDVVSKVQKRKDGLVMDSVGSMFVRGKFILTSGLVNIKGAIRNKGIRTVDGDAILASDKFTSLPAGRQPKVMGLKATGKPESHWSDEERDALKKLVDKHGGHFFEAARIFAAETGRSLRGVEYQWYHPKRTKANVPKKEKAAAKAAPAKAAPAKKVATKPVKKAKK